MNTESAGGGVTTIGGGARIAVSDIVAPGLTCRHRSAAVSRWWCTAPGTARSWRRIPTCTLDRGRTWCSMRARAAFDTWRWTPSWKRAQILERTSHLHRGQRRADRAPHRRRGRQAAQGCARRGRRGASTFRWAAEESQAHGRRAHRDGRRAVGREPLRLDDPRAARRHRRHLAVQLPAQPGAHKVAPALATANVVVLKPASTTPLTALRLAELLDEAGLPDDVIAGRRRSGRDAGHEAGQRRARQHGDLHRQPAGRPADRRDAGMKMLTLELGNNSATIVDEDANLDLAVQRIVAGGFANSGQVCISVQRVVVHEKVYDEFMAKLVPAVEALKVGDPLDEPTDVAALITPSEESERVQELGPEARRSGRDAGHRRDRRGRPPAADGAHRRDARHEGLRTGGVRPGARRSSRRATCARRSTSATTATSACRRASSPPISTRRSTRPSISRSAAL